MSRAIRHLPSRLLDLTVRRFRRKRQRSAGRIRFEQLERRDLLATIWRNPVDALDVVADGVTVPLDVLNVINELNNNGSRRLPDQKDPAKPYWDTSGDQFIAPLDALQVINALNAAKASPYRIKEGTTLNDQSTVTITLGQPDGKRTYRLRIDAKFDQSDQNAVVDDVFAVYLVNPLNLSQTLLDRGQPGTALFTLSPRGADFQPGLVRWDGSILELDTSSLAARDTGVLKLQLLGTDADRGTQITVQPLTNEVDPRGTSGPSFPSAALPRSAGGGLDLTGLAPVTTIGALVENVRFDEIIGRLSSDVRLRAGSESIGRNVAVVFPNLPAGVTLRNASGTTAAGAPYLNWQPAMPPGGLEGNAISERLLVEFDDPSRVQFTLAPRVLAAINHPPTLDPVGPLTVFPGGVLSVPLVAVDQDGDTVTFAIRNVTTGTLDPVPLPTGKLGADGTLVFRPAPNQLGTYNFEIIASDGALEAIRAVTLNVVADPITTTRVSGRVLQVNGQPLASMPVEIGAVQGLTAADGSFLLDLGSGSIVSDTLKVRGERFSGPVAYPFIGEKLPLILEHDIYPNVNNVVERPIFLPALDIANGKDINPAQDTTVTTAAIPGASVLVKSGTLMNQQGTPFTGKLSITEVPRDLTPAALPPSLIPDLVVTVQPGEMVFAAPAPMTFPNPTGWPAGTLMDLWSINPVTGNFDDVGDMRVSPDGSKIETISGGVRNSSWHFAARPAPTPTPIASNPQNQMQGCNHTLS